MFYYGRRPCRGVGMDLAQSILKELITLQKKNEELARIITKLEHESDVIIQQFERKIEELQTGLKHEQDEKSRSSRRYEAEIRELESARDAQILETTNVRETFQSMVTGLEEKISTLTETLQNRQQEILTLQEEKTALQVSVTRDIDSLKQALLGQEAVARADKEVLLGTIRHLDEQLHTERSAFAQVIARKDDELLHADKELDQLQQHFAAERVKWTTRDAESQQALDQLHHLIATERQIRTRELTERDIQTKKYEADLASAKEETEQYRIRLTEWSDRSAHEISSLQSSLSDMQDSLSAMEVHSAELTSKLENLTAQHKTEIQRYETVVSDLKARHEEEVLSLNREIESNLESYAVLIRQKETFITDLEQQVSGLMDQIREDANEHERVLHELSDQVISLESSSTHLTQSLQESTDEQIRLQHLLRDYQNSCDREMQVLRQEKEQLESQLTALSQRSASELSILKNSRNEIILERDNLVSLLAERENYYRDEISLLHAEISEIVEKHRLHEQEFIQGQEVRDRHIIDLTSRNEALRLEIDTLRSQYAGLQQSIRSEKEESVHALYRELTALRDRMLAKEQEIRTLSEKVLRLDAENTRLVHLNKPPASCENEPHPSSPLSSASPVITAPMDPRKKEVSLLITDLDDPARAPMAAAKLAGMGPDIVDQMIPLLHTGSIQRRVWIAVVLYEINDNRATLPLMKLLETPKVHFRELIWEAKNQMHTRSQLGLKDTGLPQSGVTGPEGGVRR